MPAAVYVAVSSMSAAPALPDDASLLCGDSGTWHSDDDDPQSLPAMPVTDRRDALWASFLSVGPGMNLTLRWTQSGTDDDADRDDDE